MEGAPRSCTSFHATTTSLLDSSRNIEPIWKLLPFTTFLKFMWGKASIVERVFRCKVALAVEKHNGCREVLAAEQGFRCGARQFWIQRQGLLVVQGFHYLNIPIFQIVFENINHVHLVFLPPIAQTQHGVMLVKTCNDPIQHCIQSCLEPPSPCQRINPQCL